MAAQAPVYWPTRAPRVTEEAGTRGGTHTGIDLAASVGDPVLAPFDGVAVFVGGDGARGSINGVRANGEGLTVDIRRADGMVARLGHLSGFNVRQGETVTAGQVIAYAGNTGFSTGPHVHWELRWDRAWVGGNWINPRTVAPQIFTAAPAATIRKDTRMHAVRQIGLPDSGVIIGGGQPPRARTNSVFVAECAALGITPVDCPAWQYQTLIREAWADFSTTTRYIADAVAGKIPKGSTTPLGLSDADKQAIAKAVADEQAKRMQS